ncbi:MAG: helix-turn-helix domain-containing protein, partial [Actinomycetota bacterium]
MPLFIAQACAGVQELVRYSLNSLNNRRRGILPKEAKRPSEFLAGRLKEVRLAKGGLTQKALGQLVGLDHAAVAKIETGQRGISL